MRKNVSPRATSLDQGLEAAHLLHAVDFAVCEGDAWVLGVQAGGDGWEIGGAE